MSKKSKAEYKKEALELGVKFNKKATIEELQKAIELAKLGNIDTPEIKEETPEPEAKETEQPEPQPNRKEFEGVDYYYQGWMPNKAMCRKQKKHIESTEYRSVIFEEQTPNIIHLWKAYVADLAKK